MFFGFFLLLGHCWLIGRFSFPFSRYFHENGKLKLWCWGRVKNDPKQALEIKKKMTSVLSQIGVLGSYSKSKNINTGPLTNLTNSLFIKMDMSKDMWMILSTDLEIWCNIVNSIQIDFINNTFATFVVDII